MKLMRRTFAVSMAAAAALGVLTTGSAFAQAQPAFPNKVIRIVPFGTGAGRSIRWHVCTPTSSAPATSPC